VIETRDYSGPCEFTYSVSFNRTQSLLGIYHVFGLLWNVQIVQALGVLMIADAVSAYY